MPLDPQPPQKMPHLLSFLEHQLDVTFSIDEDDNLRCRYPKHIDVQQVCRRFVHQYRNAIWNDILCRAARERFQIVNGPHCGSLHDFDPGEVITIPVSPHKWAAYVVSADGRAFFQGYGTTRRKARHLEVSPPEKK